MYLRKPARLTWRMPGLALIVLLAISSLDAQAQFTYSIAGGQVTITGYTGTVGNITIPSTIEGLPVTLIGNSAFTDKKLITSVIIPDSVVSIGNEAFRRCSGLQNTSIGTGVISIGSYAFAACTNLRNLVVGSNVRDIGAHAYDGCVVMTNVTISDTVTTIGDYAFNNGSKIKTVTIGSNVLSIGASAFRECGTLTNIFIPNNVKNINAEAFRWCDGLTSISFGTGLTNIGLGAFAYCTALKRIDIPDNVKSLGAQAFYTCYGLTNATIGNGTTIIGANAFQSCSGLKTAIIGSAINGLGDWSFGDCDALFGVYFRGNAPLNVVDTCFSTSTNVIVYYLLNTTGWGSTFAGRPTALWNIASLSINPMSTNFSSTASTGRTIGVSANIAWTATSNVSWIAITGGASGTGNGVVMFSVAANSASSRTGGIVVAGGGISLTCVVVQAGISIPLAPTGVIATDGTYPNKVEVSWSASSGATGYEVWRSTSNNTNSANRIAHGEITPPYNDLAVTQGTTYYYWLIATNAGGASVFSSSDSGYAHVAIPSLTGTITYGGSQTGLIHVVARSQSELPDLTLSLDGIDDSVSIETPSASLQLGSQMTICSWINMTGTINGTSAAIVNKLEAPTRLSYEFSIIKSTGNPYFNSGDGRRFYGDYIVSTSSGWTHLAFTHDGTVGVWYVNGQFSLLTTNPPIQRYGNGSFNIGNLFPGQLDDIGLWTRTFSQGEIHGVMSNGMAGAESGLAGFWDFNDGTATDRSTNFNNGFFQNGATTVTGRVKTVFNEFSTNVTLPGGYVIYDLPNGEYTVWAYRDSSGNGSKDSWEACGSYPANPIVITGAMQNIDIVLQDPITDSDGDGLTDYDEVYLHGTSWSNRDSDADGMLDGDEVVAGSNPANPASTWGVAMPTYDGTWHTNVIWDDGAWVTQAWLHAERCILGWQTLTGRTYRLYATTNLSGPWVANSPPIAGTGSNISFSTDNIDPLNWYFRLGVELDP